MSSTGGRHTSRYDRRPRNRLRRRKRDTVDVVLTGQLRSDNVGVQRPSRQPLRVLGLESRVEEVEKDLVFGQKEESKTPMSLGEFVVHKSHMLTPYCNHVSSVISFL